MKKIIAIITLALLTYAAFGKTDPTVVAGIKLGKNMDMSLLTPNPDPSQPNEYFYKGDPIGPFDKFVVKLTPVSKKVVSVLMIGALDKSEDPEAVFYSLVLVLDKKYKGRESDIHLDKTDLYLSMIVDKKVRIMVYVIQKRDHSGWLASIQYLSIKAWKEYRTELLNEKKKRYESLDL